MFLAQQYGEFFNLACHWLLSVPQVNKQRGISVYEMAIENHIKREIDVGFLGRLGRQRGVVFGLV